MTTEEARERIELLLSLPGEHPSFLKYLDKYLNYLTDEQLELGLDYSDTMIKKLSGKLYREGKDKMIILQEAINDLKVIRRSDSIQLTRLPLSSYLFARTVAKQFLTAITPQRFVDPVDRALMLDNKFFQEKFSGFFALLRGARDVFEYYSKFRKTLIIYMVNNILKPEHVRPYRKLVEFLETKVEETSAKLALIDQNEKINLMNNFGTITSSTVSGEVTKSVLLSLIDGGISYLIKLRESSDPEDQAVAASLLNTSNAFPGEPLHDFMYELEHGVGIIYCRTRAEIIEAQKIAQSLLNIYSPEVLLKTALNTVYEITTYNLQYDRDVVLETTKSNLDLLQANGIITTETQLKYEAQVEKML